MKVSQHPLLVLSLGLQSALGLAAARTPEPSAPPTLGMSQAGAIPPDPSGPPGMGWQVLGGMAYGSGGLLVGGTSGAILLSLACYQWSEDCGFAGLGGALIGSAVGFASAFPLGVYRFGTDDNVSGSWKWTYASALLGSAVGFGGWALISGLEDQDHWFQAALLGTAGAPIGALIGFNATRGARKGVPEVSVAPMPGGGFAGLLTWRLTPGTGAGYRR